MFEREDARLRVLRSTGLLDSPPDPTFDRFTRLAARLLKAPCALVGLVDESREFFLSTHGLGEPWASRREVPLTRSFCHYAVRNRASFVVNDAREHPLVRHNQAVYDPGVMAYVGIPIVLGGEAIGAVSVVDVQPRAWSDEEVRSLGDLTECVVSEIELRLALDASRARCSFGEALVETLGDSVLAVDAAGKFLVVNAAARRLFAYGADVGRPLPANWAALHRATLPDGSPLPSEDGAIARGLRGEPTDGLEFALVRSYASETRWVEACGRPVLGARGEVVAAVAVYRDITDRKQRVDAAHMKAHNFAQMEGRYRGLLEAAPDAMVVVNERGDIVLLNLQAERVFGYRRDELVGQPVTNLIPEGFAERLISDETRTAAEALAQQIGTGIELAGRRKDGTSFPIELMLSPLESPDGVLVTAAIRDISLRKKAEEHLARMEGRYRGLLEAAPDAMVVVNERGDIVLLNLQAERVFGYRRDELVGQPVSNLIPEGFAERLIADETRTAAEALAQQIGAGIELAGRRKDGSSFPIELMLSPLESPDGILVTAAIRDIGLRKKAEKHLAQMEGRYRGLLEAAPDAMVVVNERGEIVVFNNQVQKLFGYRREQLLGQSIEVLIPARFRNKHRGHRTGFFAHALPRAMGAGLELHALRENGTEFPVEISLIPLEGSDGLLVTAAIRDISVRKEQEKHLAQMEGRYRGLLEAAPDAMVLVNRLGDIVLVNAQAEKQFVYRREELVGRKLETIIPEVSTIFSDIERRIAQALQSESNSEMLEITAGGEFTGRRRDGSDLPVDITISVLRSAEGVLVTVAIRDVTARRAAKAQLLRTLDDLKRSNEDLERFAYLASHDLQEPLRMVASYTQLLARRYKGRLDADADEFIAFAVDGANRMQQLIQDLLTYSRAGTKRADLIEVSSNDALELALTNLRGAIESSGARVTHDPLPGVLADEGQLVQLFQNLVGNAIKYQGPGVPSVHVSSTPNGEAKWSFSIKDNGLGIEPQYFERIFGMFQRLNKREEFEGTGIGLAICKKIVERHGGIISVESQLGLGSTFRFDLARSEDKS